MPRIVGGAVRVVDHDGLSIDELVGNVSTKVDTLSAAKVVVAQPTQEPWLTLHYDEWICVTRGRCDMRYIDAESKETVLAVHAGQTCFVAKGERFRPEFPLGDTEYIPVCIPAFKPERCIREEGDVESDVTTKLKELHYGRTEDPPKSAAVGSSQKKFDSIDLLYHMCPKDSWNRAVKMEEAYFPATFEADGNFVHATALPAKLIEVGNHFYQSDSSEWICLELSRSMLQKKCGIVTIFEAPAPVGDTSTSESWEHVLFPHIYGGIPTCVGGIVTNVFPVKRGHEGSFIEITGLTK
mmetsp:Transcript_12179/g.25811  ORF Transcript_12179/g.25811 Transcript_12179/m.25811 type:complete len:296 (-) Transcript_12179:32-919(-)